MASSIFLIHPDNSLAELQQAPFASEDLLQKLLADHPSLLGSTGNASSRVLLIRREFGVPESDGGTDRWSLDHLFVDNEGVPVLVEVKRASDTRSRREVVAQMLDYAANGVVYWPIDRMISAFRDNPDGLDPDPDARLAAFLDSGDPDAFWRQVEANLRAGRIRLVFVADRIPAELRRIVEFLNEQMRPAEVLALELEQFVNPDGFRTLVPRLFGNTQRAEASKSIKEVPQPISELEWLDILQDKKGKEIRKCAEEAINWFRDNRFSVIISKAQDSLQASVTQANGKPAWPFFVRRSSGTFDVALTYLKNTPTFKSEDSRRDLLERLQAISGTSFTSVNPSGWSSIPLSDLAHPGVWEALQLIAIDVRDRLQTEAAESV
jgi:hypothetical protein